VVTEEVEVSVLVTVIAFPLSQDEARDPVMKHVLEAGYAASIGLEAEKVSVTHANGQVIARRLAVANIRFVVESASNSPTEIQALRANIVAAATEGSLVANIQKLASDNGVLTPGLFSMARVLHSVTWPAVTESTQTKVVRELRRITLYPTASPIPTVPPTPAPTTSYIVGLVVEVRATYVSDMLTLVEAMEAVELESVTKDKEPSPSTELICWPNSCNVCSAAESECCSNFVASNDLCSTCVENKGCQATGYLPEPGVGALVVARIDTASNSISAQVPGMHLEVIMKDIGAVALRQTDREIVPGEVEGHPGCDTGLCTSESPSFGASIVNVQLPPAWKSTLPGFERLVYEVAVSDFTEAKVIPSRIELDFDSPSAQVIVIGVDDKAMDGNRPFEVVLTGTMFYRSGQFLLQKQVLERRTQFLNLDDDVAGIKVVQTPGDRGRLTYEALPDRYTKPALFTVELTAEPCCVNHCPCSDAHDLAGAQNSLSSVVVPVTSMNIRKGVTTTPFLSFDQVNWNVPQYANFTGVDDDVVDYETRTIDAACALDGANMTRAELEPCIMDEPTNYHVLFGVCDSPTDTNYHGKHFETFKNMGSVSDDVMGINLTQMSNFTSEDGTITSKLGVSLLSEPKASILLTLVSTRADKSWCSPAIFAFSSADWNVPQISIVQGFDDDLPDGDVPFVMEAIIVFAEDPDYGNQLVGMRALTEARGFISIGEPDCATLEASSAFSENIKCDGPYSEETCKPGYRSRRPDGVGDCTPCGIGYFNPLFNATKMRNCVPCPLGMAAKPGAFVASATLSDACELCPEGSYAPTPGLSVCIDCTSLGHPDTVFCAYGANHPLPISTLHRQTGTIHEWGDIISEKFKYEGRVLPWEPAKVMTLEAIQDRMFLLVFIPVILVMVPVIMLHFIHVMYLRLKRRKWYADWEDRKFNHKNGHWAWTKTKQNFAATKIQSLVRCKIIDAGVQDLKFDVKVALVARKLARQWRRRAARIALANGEETADELKLWLKTKGRPPPLVAEEDEKRAKLMGGVQRS
jgi:hypothetical protein